MCVTLILGSSYHDGLNLPPSPKHRGRNRNRYSGVPGGIRAPLIQQGPVVSPTTSRSNSREPLYRTTSLETRSHSPSPTSTPTTVHNIHEYYGTANLTDRSRSPSPSARLRAAAAANKRGGRRLPATPNKPSTLFLNKPTQPPNQLSTQPTTDNNMPHVIPSPTVPQPQKSPGSINFPHLNASPTHLPIKPIPNSASAALLSNRSLVVSPSDDFMVHTRTGSHTLPRNTISSAPLLNNGRPDPLYGRTEDTLKSNTRYCGDHPPLRHRKQPKSDSDDDDWC